MTSVFKAAPIDVADDYRRTYDARWTGDKAIRERWRGLLLLAGVRYRNPYQTRPTFASSLLMLGANPMYVATQLGRVDSTLVFQTFGRWIASGLDNDRRQRLLKLYTRTDVRKGDEFPRFG
ncbi:hypothetical protein ACSUZJ_14710 [Telluria sp. B2]